MQDDPFEVPQRTFNEEEDLEQWFTAVSVDGPAIVTFMSRGDWRLSKDDTTILQFTLNVEQGGKFFVPPGHKFTTTTRNGFASGYKFYTDDEST